MRLSVTQSVLLADLVLGGLVPAPSERRTARSLVRHGLADWRGQWLYITKEGEKAIGMEADDADQA